MTGAGPRFLPCGDTALTVDFGNVIAVELNRRVHALARHLDRAEVPGVIETVPTYRSLTVHYDPLVIGFEALCETLHGQLETVGASAHAGGRHWEVPVVFGGAFGEDLVACAEKAGMSASSLIRAFTAPRYTVMMVGFMPGFSYLSGLPEALARPRLDTPRARVPAGSVSIGGAQAAIGSVAGPSGWHLLGRTPALPFLQSRQPMFLFAAGDEISFVPIDAGEWAPLSAAAAQGDPVARLVSEEGGQ